MSEESLIGSALSKNNKNNGYRNCPLCGGKARRWWKKVCAKNVIVFLVSAILAFFCFGINCSGIGSSQLLILSLVLIGLAAVAFIALPITGAIAIASRSRCKACGHRFWPVSIAPNLPADARFPGILTVIGIAIILTVFFIQVGLIRDVPGKETIGVTIYITGWIILAWMILGLFMLCQAFVWRNFHSNKASLLFLLPMAAIIAGLLAHTFNIRSELFEKFNPISRAPHTLAWANLASLPESAHDVHVYAFCILFVRKDYLRFEAEPEDIEKFIADSPALKKLTCHTYSKDRMRLATTDYKKIFDQDLKDDPNWSFYFENKPYDSNEYFDSINEPPSWYKEEIRGAGRYYKLSEHETSWIGELIIDDEKHIVYIYKGS